MARGGVSVKFFDKDKVETVEDRPKMMILAILMMLGSHLDEYKRATRNGNPERAAEAVGKFFEAMEKVWPHDYGTLQKATKYIGEDLGYIVDDIAVQAGIGNA